jgi:hypothetical protein
MSKFFWNLIKIWKEICAFESILHALPKLHRSKTSQKSPYYKLKLKVLCIKITIFHITLENSFLKTSHKEFCTRTHVFTNFDGWLEKLFNED